MFALAYVLLPFSDEPPADLIHASLAPFQRGGRGDLPEASLRFQDETDTLRLLHRARLTFTARDGSGLRIEGDTEACWYIAAERVRDEMHRRDLRRWSTRFADAMDLESFVARFCQPMERHPITAGFGRWVNPLGRWDWWDLGGRFDGYIVADPARATARPVASLSSGDNPGRAALANLEDRLADALGQEPIPEVEVLSSRNIELVATLLADARADSENAFPSALVLPPGSVSDGLRWVDTWPELGPAGALSWLGLSFDAEWPAVASATYTRFKDHWAAGVAYHC